MVYVLAIVAGVVAFVVGSLLRRWVDGRPRDRYLRRNR